MVKASKGLRTGTRDKLSKPFKSKYTITPYLREFGVGDKVIIRPNPESHKGMPHFRFLGSVGAVTGRRGDAYVVDVLAGKKMKSIIARPEHLKPLPKR